MAGGTAMYASKGKAKNATSKARTNSSAPASVPSDNRHIYKRSPLKKYKQASKRANSKGYASPVKHIYKGSSAIKQKAKKNAVKTKARPKSDLKFVIPSEAPTALIAPSDYEHIYADPDESAIKGSSGAKQKAKMKTQPKSANKFIIPSEAPTALIAPSDYEHMYADPDESVNKGTIAIKQEAKTKATPKSANKFNIPSEAPTALIAPSDYEHLYKGDDEIQWQDVNRAGGDSQNQEVSRPQQDENQEMDLQPEIAKDKSQGQAQADHETACCCCCVLM